MTVVWPRDGAKVRFDFRIVVVAEKFGRTRFTQLSFSLPLSLYLYLCLSIYLFLSLCFLLLFFFLGRIIVDIISP